MNKPPMYVDPKDEDMLHGGSLLQKESRYIVYFVQYVNDAGIDGHTCVGLGIDHIRLRSYATSHTRYRVDETGVQVMRCTVRQSM